MTMSDFFYRLNHQKHSTRSEEIAKQGHFPAIVIYWITYFRQELNHEGV